MNEILFRLVRNNAWIMQRYAPVAVRQREIDVILERYRVIALKEDAMAGYERGVSSLAHTLGAQSVRTLSQDHWDRFTGRAAARSTLKQAFKAQPGPVRLVGPANPKGGAIIADELERLGCTLVDDPDATAVISTLSPGPMLDAGEAHGDAIRPWVFD